MTNYFKHWALLLCAAMALTIGFSSCEEENPDNPDQPGNPDDPVLTIDPTSIEINDLGGTASVAYTIEKPVEGANISVTTEQTWVHDFTVHEKNINFRVDANAEAKDRTAQITFTYDKAKAELTVKQLALAPNFDIQIDESKLTTQTVTFNVVPKDKEMNYVVIHITKEFYEKLGSDDAIFAKFKEQFGSSAEFWGESLLEYLEKEGYLFKGDAKDIMYEGHEPDTDNYLIAFGIDYYEERTTAIEKAPYHTKAIEMSDMTFDMTVNVDKLDISVGIVPSREDQYYYTSIITKKELESSGMNIEDYVQNYMNEKIQVEKMFGGTAESAVKAQCRTGKADLLYEGLASATDYVVFAVGFNLQGERITAATSENVATEEALGSLNEITFDISEIGADRATVKTTTTNDDPYIIIVHKVSRYEGFSDQDIVDYLVQYQTTFELENHTYTGDAVLDRRGLTVDTDYYALAFGFAGGVATTPLVKSKFTTSAPANASDLTITTSVENLTSASAYVNITGEPSTVLYYWDICKTDVSDNEILTSVSDEADRQVSMGYAKDRVSYFIQVGKRGTTGYGYENLEPGTEYVPYAIAIDEKNNGEFATGVLRGTPFTTKEKGVSVESVEVHYDKYWDADDVAEIYDSYYDDYAGQNQCVVPMTVTHTEGVVSTYTILFEGDWSDRTLYTDAWWIQQLYDYKNGNYQSKLEYFAPFDTPCTIGSVGRDADGNFTKAFVERVVFDKAGASDISGFTPASLSVPFLAPVAPSEINDIPFAPQSEFRITEKNLIR